MGETVTFWERVAEEVSRQGTTFRWLAERLDVNESTVSTWRARGTSPRAEEAARIALALGVSVEYLALGEGPQVVPVRLRDVLDDLSLLSPERIEDVARLVRPWADEVRRSIQREPRAG